MAQARAKPSIENFYEWRKRVKDLGYQVRLLKPIWPGMLDGLAMNSRGWPINEAPRSKLRRITELNFADFSEAEANPVASYGEYSSLSDDRDLAFLRQTVLQRTPEDRTQLEALVALIDQRGGELEVKTGRLGKRMYVEKSNAFVRRFDVYWRAWCAETKVDSIAIS